MRVPLLLLVVALAHASSVSSRKVLSGSQQWIYEYCGPNRQWIDEYCGPNRFNEKCQKAAAMAFLSMAQAARLSTTTMATRAAGNGPISSRLFQAIRKVETGSLCNNAFAPCTIKGDGGRALGPYQIHKIYYDDAVSFRPSLGSRPYRDVTDRNFAEQVMQAYISRYATRSRLGHSPTDQDIARIHNGGPNGHRYKSTLNYWRRVKSHL